MNFDLATAQLIAVTVMLGWLAGAVAVAAWWPTQTLSKLEPRARIRRTMGALLAPVVSAVFLSALVFAPSVLHAVGIAADHCLEHAHHAFHLCLVHGTAPIDLAVLAVVTAMGAAVLFHVGRTLGTVTSKRRKLRSLLSVGREREAVVELESAQPVAFTAGYRRPRVVVSSSLREALTDDEFAIVLAHERDHVAHRDGLIKLAATLLTVVHLPGIGRALRREVDRSCEEAADRAAAHSVGSRLKVAETLIRVERLLGRRPAASIGFADGDLRRRVSALVDEPSHDAPGQLLPATILLVAALALFHLEAVHHGVESLVGLLI